MTETFVASTVRRETVLIPASAPVDEPILFVDLDGTLIKNDLLVESMVALVRQKPAYSFAIFFWLLRGRACVKAELAQRVKLSMDTLPLQSEFVEHLQGERARGRTIYLATASHSSLAEQIAQRLGIFTGVLASDGEHNLKGAAKLEEILAVTGGACFDYAGNAWADLRIWGKARRGIIVNPHFGVRAAAQKCCSIERVFDDRPSVIRAWIRQLRLYQWLKNLLLGIPLLTAHVFDPRSLLAVLVAFFAFGCVASAGYLLNDLIDLPTDRQHPRKRKRPLAAGDLAMGTALGVMIALLAAGLIAAALDSPSFLLVLVAYLILTLGYSLYLKTLVLVDVIVLAALFTIRIIAGAVVIRVQMSSWLLAFSMFTFFSLALVKRTSELVTVQGMSREAVSGRDYRVSDYGTLTAMGVASGYVAVVVLALFIDSPQARGAYSHPGLLWPLCPLMIYWVSRLWIKTGRGEMHDDPLLYSARDRASWLVFAAMTLTTLLAI